MTKSKIKKNCSRTCVTLIEIFCSSSDFSKLFFVHIRLLKQPPDQQSKTEYVCKLSQPMVITLPHPSYSETEMLAFQCVLQVTAVSGPCFARHCSHQDSCCASSDIHNFMWKVTKFPIQTKFKKRDLESCTFFPRQSSTVPTTSLKAIF